MRSNNFLCSHTFRHAAAWKIQTFRCDFPKEAEYGVARRFHRSARAMCRTPLQITVETKGRMIFLIGTISVHATLSVPATGEIASDDG